MKKPREFYLQVDNKDIQTYEYFASESKCYDDDIHVIEYSEYNRIKVRLEATDKYLRDAMDVIQVWMDRAKEAEAKLREKEDGQ